MTEGYTREESKEMLKKMQMEHHFYNVIDDLDTIGSDDLRVFLDETPDFFPDCILHFCRKCDCMTGFVGYRNNGEDHSTYVLATMLGDTPSIMFRKIYQCSCGREFITVTGVFEQVGFNLEYGFHPINYEEYLKKNSGDESNVS